MVTRRMTSNPDEFLEALERCVEYQGIRATARRLGWHPSRLYRAMRDWGRLPLRDAIRLAFAVGGWIEFAIPVTDSLFPRVTGRPKASRTIPDQRIGQTKGRSRKAATGCSLTPIRSNGGGE